MTKSAPSNQKSVRTGMGLGEELANSIIHGVGALLSMLGLAVLVTLARRRGDPWVLVGVSIFGVSLVLLYTVSCVFHALYATRAKGVFQKLDHSFIFVLIAGSYTPFLIVNLRGPWGWSLLGVIWTLAAGGIVLKSLLLPRYEKRTSVIYIVMGLLMVAAITEVIATVPRLGIIWLIVGGAFYICGVVFFVLERVPYFHAVWHLCVIAGSVSHFFAVLYGVVWRAG